MHHYVLRFRFTVAVVLVLACGPAAFRGHRRVLSRGFGENRFRNLAPGA